MENDGFLNTTAFVSKRTGGDMQRMPQKRKAKRRLKGSGSGTASLFLSLGVCAAALAGLLWIKLANAKETISVMSDLSKSVYSTTEPSLLGKLKFVELPSIIDVFAPSDGAVLPVNAEGCMREGDGGGLRIKTKEGADVVAPLGGRITAVGEDPALGKYVSFAADGDVEIAIYGFSSVDAEMGQPVRQRQKLGTALSENITVRAWRAGRPLEVSSLFGIGEES